MGTQSLQNVIMKLIYAFLAVGAFAQSKLEKCAQIPKGGRRRYTQPRTIERGNNNPAAIDFLIDNRGTLMDVFAYGERAELDQIASTNMATIATFADVTQDQYLGQIFRAAKAEFNQCTLEGQNWVKENYGEQLAALYRDNTQRIAKVIRDISYSPALIRKLFLDDITFADDLREMVNARPDATSEAYKVFLENHLDSFIPAIKSVKEKFEMIHKEVQKSLVKVLEQEKMKATYRQLVNELPLVYQFFNDNIDFIELQNVDKDLSEAITADILHTLATESGDKQVASMIKRNEKFIKTIMTDRAMQQQKEKVVTKVMEKNKELKAAVANEAEFNRLLEEAKQTGKQLTEEMKQNIWNTAVENVKSQAKEELGNQTENKDNTKHKPKKGLSRYEHLSSLMGLMPDELAQPIAQMVKESCPELDLLRIDTEVMKAIVEEQPDNFIDQLIKELHDVCDMFGLIDKSKVTKKIVGEGENAVEVEIYEADWAQGEKVQ